MRHGNAILDGIKAATLAPSELEMLGASTEAEWLVRECVLCNNQVDRDFERFSVDLLRDFAKTLPGRSLLVGHRRDGVGEGLWVRGTVIDEGGRAELRAVFAIPVLDDEANKTLRNRVESGLARFVSIGFGAAELLCDICGEPVWGSNTQCPHWPGDKTQDGRVATATWQAPGETLEGSLVYLGAQYGAEVKDAREAFGDRADALANAGPYRVKGASTDGALVLREQDLVAAAVRIAGARGADGLSDEARAEAWLEVARGYKMLGRQAPTWRPGWKFEWDQFSADDRLVWSEADAVDTATRIAGSLGRLKGAVAPLIATGRPLPAAVESALATVRELAGPLPGVPDPDGSKVGRVLSRANLTLVEAAMEAAEALVAALRELRDAAEPPASAEDDDDKCAPEPAEPSADAAHATLLSGLAAYGAEMARESAPVAPYALLAQAGARVRRE